MMDMIRIGALTLVVFLVGLGAGIWTQHLRPLPPPPALPLGEFGAFHGAPSPAGDPLRFPLSPEKAAELQAIGERLRPQIKAFEEKLSALEGEFRAQFEAILTPEQKKLFANRPPLPSFGPPGGGGQPGPMLDALGGLAFFTIITPALNYLNKELNLTVDQQARLKELLGARRQAFLNLVDSTPPPSLELGRLVLPPPGR